MNDQFEPKFQFHKGTIRTKGERKNDCIPIHFNSIKVRLEQNKPSITIVRIEISIP